MQLWTRLGHHPGLQRVQRALLGAGAHHRRLRRPLEEPLTQLHGVAQRHGPWIHLAFEHGHGHRGDEEPVHPQHLQRHAEAGHHLMGRAGIAQHPLEEGHLGLRPGQQRLAGGNLSEGAERHRLRPGDAQRAARTLEAQRLKGRGLLREDHQRLIHAGLGPLGQSVRPELQGQGQREAGLEDAPQRRVAHQLRGEGRLGPAQVLQPERQVVAHHLSDRAHRLQISRIRQLRHQGRVGHPAQLVLEVLPLQLGQASQGGVQVVHPFLGGNERRRPTPGGRGARVHAAEEAGRLVERGKAQILEPRGAETVGGLLQLAGDFPARGLQQTHRLEGVLGDQVVEDRPQRRLLHALDLELDEVAPLGRLHRHAGRMDVRVLLQVMDVGELAQQVLQHLEVHPVQLAQELLGRIAPRGPQPGEHPVHIDAIPLPGPQIHEGPELRGRGELNELGGIRQPHLLNGGEEQLRRERPHQGLRLGGLDEGIQPLAGRELGELPAQLPEGELRILAVSLLVLGHAACLPHPAYSRVAFPKVPRSAFHTSSTPILSTEENAMTASRGRSSCWASA
ncbi:conserved hypothetical protein [Stigmatella aurantiaca DW4/3-1]|uniref:Uncharacterized protein n=1 Tax=Stigmatella aurantiaca (strain DW4/3-1) TaxID=378806 RepID=Q08UE9_STIAD|nr:conserved hypothetical protein [Stigmatella aurantiaca DW4/3-1]